MSSAGHGVESERLGRPRLWANSLEVRYNSKKQAVGADVRVGLAPPGSWPLGSWQAPCPPVKQETGTWFCPGSGQGHLGRGLCRYLCGSRTTCARVTWYRVSHDRYLDPVLDLLRLAVWGWGPRTCSLITSTLGRGNTCSKVEDHCLRCTTPHTFPRTRESSRTSVGTNVWFKAVYPGDLGCLRVPAQG